MKILMITFFVMFWGGVVWALGVPEPEPEPEPAAEANPEADGGDRCLVTRYCPAAAPQPVLDQSAGGKK